ncbi:MAG: hypothetical protein ACYS0E_09525 [Planctomycetota bacterium]
MHEIFPGDGCRPGVSMFYANERDVPAKFRRLTNLVGMLSEVSGVRNDLVDDIRDQIDRGEYLTEEKLNEAIHRLLREIMAEEERL